MGNPAFAGRGSLIPISFFPASFPDAVEGFLEYRDELGSSREQFLWTRRVTCCGKGRDVMLANINRTVT
jgi:hypothetical protein